MLGLADVAFWARILCTGIENPSKTKRHLTDVVNQFINATIVD
jgi:hypothetical protein